MQRGKLIVFEGISGTGKETQAKLLKEYLVQKHIKTHIVFHPSTEIKPILRAQKTVNDQIKVLAADRGSKVREVIRPAIRKGEWVISLRNYVSAYVYQGNGTVVKKVDMNPDYLFYFDITPMAAMERILSRGEQLGKYETLKLLKTKRRKYKRVLKTIPHYEVDASQTIMQIHKEIRKYLSATLK